jgi:hypothetical protein
MNCEFDPTKLKYTPIGMLHCPLCGEMVLAGYPHPDYSLLEEDVHLHEETKEDSQEPGQNIKGDRKT